MGELKTNLTVQRRTSMPQELEDPEDLTVSDPDVDKYAELETASTITSRTSEVVAFSWREKMLQLPKEVRNIIAGGIAGMLAKSVVAPLDRIKILYQVTPAEFHLRHIPKVAQNIVINEGLSALWKGNLATMLRVFPYSGIQFMVFDQIKVRYLKQHELAGIKVDSPAGNPSRKFGLTPTESLFAGMIAGTVSVISTYPLDLARAQLAVLRKHRHSHNRGFVQLMADNYHNRGVAGLFRGMTVTLFGILPYSGIAFTLNEQGKREIQHLTGRDVTTFERLQCGAFAGLVGQTVTYPIEVTRRRMQTLGLVGSDTAFASLGVKNVQSSFGNKLPNVTATIRSLYAEQGVRGFYKGVSVNWMKGPIAFSISFTMFDTVQHFLETPAERAVRVPKSR